MQEAELHHLEEPPKRPGASRAQEVLPVLPSSHPPQGNPLSRESFLSDALEAAFEALDASTPYRVRALPEKAAELEAVVARSLWIPQGPSGAATGSKGPDSAGAPSRSGPASRDSDRDPRWPSLVAYCSVASLSPLAGPLEELLESESIGVLHAEQLFEFATLPQEDEILLANASLRRRRALRGSWIVQIEEVLKRSGPDASEILRGSTTLVVNDQPAVPASRGSDDVSPRSEEGSPAAQTGSASAALLVSASCKAGLDELVRYAGASGDFNPIHWDENRARRMGFERPIVHGMLMYNWVIWTVASTAQPPEKLKVRIRFLSPLQAGETAQVNLFEDRNFEVVSLGTRPHQPTAAAGTPARAGPEGPGKSSEGPLEPTAGSDRPEVRLVARGTVQLESRGKG